MLAQVNFTVLYFISSLCKIILKLLIMINFNNDSTSNNVQTYYKNINVPLKAMQKEYINETHQFTVFCENNLSATKWCMNNITDAEVCEAFGIFLKKNCI